MDAPADAAPPRSVPAASRPAPGAPPTRAGRQVIPRPDDAAPGRPAPWAALEPDRRRGVSLERVRAALEARRRRLAAFEQVTFDELPDPGRPAAVLVALFEEDGEARVVLTRRAGHLRTHTGEVSFPGGRLDREESPEAGALREAAEEIGLEPASVDIVGRLTPLATMSSGAAITPVVGFLGARPAVVPNPNEVERVFDVALSDLTADGVFSEELWVLPPGLMPANPLVRDDADADGSFPMWFFELAHDTVWGATARVLMELLRLTLGV
jgi:8-oxo-dGTP pyrophosphatase MutT (NUDIX family)